MFMKLSAEYKKEEDDRRLSRFLIPCKFSRISKMVNILEPGVHLPKQHKQNGTQPSHAVDETGS